MHDSTRGPRYHRLELVPAPWLCFATGRDDLVSLSLAASRRFVFWHNYGLYGLHPRAEHLAYLLLSPTKSTACMCLSSLPLCRCLLPDYRDAVSFSHLALHVTEKSSPAPNLGASNRCVTQTCPAHACSRFASVARRLLHSRLLLSDWTWLGLEIDALTSVVGPERSTTRTADSALWYRPTQCPGSTTSRLP